MPITLEHRVTEVIIPPYQRVDNEYCCWEAKVAYECWGGEGTRVFRKTTKMEIDQIAQEGHVWEE